MSNDEENQGYGADTYGGVPEAVRAGSDTNAGTGQYTPPVNYAPYPGSSLPMGQQAYPPVYQRQGYKKTNGMAVTGFVLSLSQILLFIGIPGILAVIFSHIGLAQARKRNENGVGLAIAGLILGYLGIAIIVAFVLYFVINANAGGSGGGSDSLDT